MNPHHGQRVLHGGTPLHTARAVLILLHGRGASAEDMISLGETVSEDVACVSILAPQAADRVWYPQRFFAPLADNEPFLSGAFEVIAKILRELTAAKLPPEKVLIGGFSQGACLALEYAWRNPRRYGGIIGLSGALIGPPGEARTPSRGLDGTPIFLGCSDRDAHIPLASVEESARLLEQAGGSVIKTIFPGMGHTVNDQEIREFKSMVVAVSASA